MSYRLINYIDSIFARDPKDQKSVMGYCFFLNKAMVSWNNKREKTVSISITKTKYIALGYIAREIVRIKRFIKKIKLKA